MPSLLTGMVRKNLTASRARGGAGFSLGSQPRRNCEDILLKTIREAMRLHPDAVALRHAALRHWRPFIFRDLHLSASAACPFSFPRDGRACAIRD